MSSFLVRLVVSVLAVCAVAFGSTGIRGEPSPAPPRLLVPRETGDPLEEFAKVKPFGAIAENSLPIFIDRMALKKAVEDARRDLTREVGGVLVGTPCQFGGKTYVRIDGIIPATKGISGSASFKFTHEAWTEIQTEKQARYPDSVLVGWYHTHPSFGIFLSGMDVFIHQGYFGLTWQVALVIDPVADKLGFFEMKNGTMQKAGFYTTVPR